MALVCFYFCMIFGINGKKKKQKNEYCGYSFFRFFFYCLRTEIRTRPYLNRAFLQWGLPLVNEAPMQQYADIPIGQVVPTFAEIREWRPGSSHLWRSFPKGKRHNVQYLKKSVKSIAQVRTLALKSLDMNFVFSQSLSSLAPGWRQSSARRRVAEREDYSSSALALLYIRTSPVQVSPLIRPWKWGIRPVVRVNVKVITIT